MSDAKKVSRRGVYYDLTKSPYEVITPYGDLFKFSSAKKKEIYTRDVEKEVAKIEKALDRHNLKNHLPREILDLIYRSTYRAFWKHVER